MERPGTGVDRLGARGRQDPGAPPPGAKRGKVEEFNRRLRGATNTSFATEVGQLDILASVRYCITLDSDTRLPRDTASKLIGIIAHPLNRPDIDRRLRRRTA